MGSMSNSDGPVRLVSDEWSFFEEFKMAASLTLDFTWQRTARHSWSRNARNTFAEVQRMYVITHSDTTMMRQHQVRLYGPKRVQIAAWHIPPRLNMSVQ